MSSPRSTAAFPLLRVLELRPPHAYPVPWDAPSGPLFSAPADPCRAETCRKRALHSGLAVSRANNSADMASKSAQKPPVRRGLGNRPASTGYTWRNSALAVLREGEVPVQAKRVLLASTDHRSPRTSRPADFCMLATPLQGFSKPAP